MTVWYGMSLLVLVGLASSAGLKATAQRLTQIFEELKV